MQAAIADPREELQRRSRDWETLLRRPQGVAERLELLKATPGGKVCARIALPEAVSADELRSHCGVFGELEDERVNDLHPARCSSGDHVHRRE